MSSHVMGQKVWNCPVPTIIAWLCERGVKKNCLDVRWGSGLDLLVRDIMSTGRLVNGCGHHPMTDKPERNHVILMWESMVIQLLSCLINWSVGMAWQSMNECMLGCLVMISWSWYQICITSKWNYIRAHW